MTIIFELSAFQIHYNSHRELFNKRDILHRMGVFAELSEVLETDGSNRRNERVVATDGLAPARKDYRRKVGYFYD